VTPTKSSLTSYAPQRNTPDPETRGRLAGAVESLGGLAHDFVIELGVSVAKGAAGLP
jgi:hypothetical protein